MHKLFIFISYLFFLSACSLTGLMPKPIIEAYVTSKSGLDDVLGYKVVKYEVPLGASLYRISQKFGLDVNELAMINRAAEGDVYKKGDVVVLALPVWDSVIKNSLNKFIPDSSLKTQDNPVLLSGIVEPEEIASIVKNERPVVDQIHSSKNNFSGIHNAVDPTIRIIDKALVQAKSFGKSSLSFGWPVQGFYDYNGDVSGWESPHLGFDLNKSNRILAVEDGNVVFTGSGKGRLGRVIIIAHNKEYMSTYTDYTSLSVELGQRVFRGEEIAEAKGDFSFGIRYKGKAVDPLEYVAPVLRKSKVKS